MLKYRVYPSKKQIAKLDYQLRICKEVYNILLDQNQKYGFTKKFDYNQIIASVKVTCKQRYGTVHSQVLQNVSDRASKAFDNFFARIKLRKQGIKVKAGYPRFKRRISSITYPQSGYKLLPNKKLWASTIGNMPIILSRPLQGNVKTLTLKKNKADQWFAVFSCEIDTPIRTHPSAEKVGIDVGLERFGTLSKNRGIIANPRFLRKSEKTLRRLQRTLSRKTLRGNNWQKQRLKVARCHVKIANQRADFLHKTSSALAKSYCHIKCEKLKIQNMLKNHCLAKSISDAGWGAFLRMLSYKELTLGGQLEGVNPAYTSQTCKVCKKRTKHILSERIFACKHCGHSEHRDNNAADNIEDTEGHSEIYTPVDTEPLQQRFVVASLVEETGTTSGASK
jgi:putative transposase